jgi:hypothetical protein
LQRKLKSNRRSSLFLAVVCIRHIGTAHMLNPCSRAL